MILAVVAATLAALSSVEAHTIFQRVYVNGVDQGYLNGVRYPSYDGPVTDVTSNSIICNGDPNPLVTPYSKTVINVPAGATVGAQWDHGLQPNGWTSSDSADPVDPSHLGPVMAYMAKVPDATVTDVTGLKWFKIWEDGFDGTNWGVTRMIAAHGNQTFTIPTCIEPGNYFLRAEMIALHGASVYPGAQFYMECAQINVVGSTGTATPSTVSFPGAYSGSDPGILINIYYPAVTNYTIPGPPVFTCPSGSGSSTAKTTTTSKATTTSTTSKATTSSTTVKTTTTTVKTTTSSSAASTATGTVAQYGQCGGAGYTGSTVCASPYVCTYSNAYYSQCL
ncbi:hypothetical protein DL93DRAFT_2173412 [Clavulina sp. PMI_390]|nr:hypothetical protein DL93DRAFT_2173412 [Clavulina sp. PMI_390]